MSSAASGKMADQPASPPRTASGEPAEEELIEFLERDQLSTDRARRVPAAELAPRVQIALWALRIFALVVSALVIYTFVATLSG